jgi:hypothetical protein
VNESEIIQIHWISKDVSEISGCLKTITRVERKDAKMLEIAIRPANFFSCLGRTEIFRKARKGAPEIRKRSIKSMSSL